MKRTVCDTLFYTVVGFCCILFSVLIGMASKQIDQQVIGAALPSPCTIVLDPGHGGEDGGATSKVGALEKDINLSIALKLRQMLTVSGFPVIMTREEDISIHDKGADTIREQKVSDLHNRIHIINSDPNHILLSIHQNNFPKGQYSGAQMFYSVNDPQSKEIAGYIKKAFVGLLQPDNTREIKPAGKNIYLLSNAKVPAVIVECGFLSNETEAQKLSKDEYQSQVAFTIYCGFLEYCANKR